MELGEARKLDNLIKRQKGGGGLRQLLREYASSSLAVVNWNSSQTTSEIHLPPPVELGKVSSSSATRGGAAR